VDKGAVVRGKVIGPTHSAPLPPPEKPVTPAPAATPAATSPVPPSSPPKPPAAPGPRAPGHDLRRDRGVLERPLVRLLLTGRAERKGGDQIPHDPVLRIQQGLLLRGAARTATPSDA